MLECAFVSENVCVRIRVPKNIIIVTANCTNFDEMIIDIEALHKNKTVLVYKS